MVKTEKISAAQARELLKKKPGKKHRFVVKPKPNYGETQSIGSWLSVKPLSVNEAWKGKRFKTDAYKAYEKLLLNELMTCKIPRPPYILFLTFGFSNMGADLDNPVKLTTDILVKKYGFNDNQIMKLVVEKVKAPRGKEFIKFSLCKYKKTHAL